MFGEGRQDALVLGHAQGDAVHDLVDVGGEGWFWFGVVLGGHVGWWW